MKASLAVLNWLGDRVLPVSSEQAKQSAEPLLPVLIVGAGPGDPELLTVKAARLLGEADVVVYDRLVSRHILDLVPIGATRIFVGKAARDHHMSQDEINELLVNLARSGRQVVRLKGGDPFVFGRGSDEAVHLAKNGIPFEVVPGVTAAAGCAAYAGIPLTHRGMAKGLRFITGHRQDDQDLDIDWKTLADPETTLVVYMGLRNVARICGELLAAGMPPEIPAAAIEKGTTPEQRIVTSTLAALPDAIGEAGLGAPTLVIIGRVVALAEILGRHMAPEEEEDGVAALR